MNGVRAWLRGLVRRQYFWGIVAILLLLGLNLIKDPTYLAIRTNPATGNLAGNLLDILRASAPILMISIGMALVIATGGIDLSVGSLMAVAGAVSMEFLNPIADASSVGAMLAAVGLALLLAGVLGAVNGVLVTVVGLQPFISTLVMMLAGRGVAKVITSGQNTTAANEPFRWIANGYLVGFPVVFLIAVAVVVLVALVVRRSALGLMIEAIGINRAASRMSGIKPRGIIISVYVMSGLLAGIAGIFAVSSVMTVDVSRTGYQLELDAILAVVIGGTSLAGGKFSFGGTVVGSLLIATLDKTVVFLGVSAAATPAFKAAVIIVLCLLQSDVRALIRRHLPGAARRGPAGGGPASAAEHEREVPANQEIPANQEVAAKRQREVTV
jgi:simple sugar transport system permease protein